MTLPHLEEVLGAHRAILFPEASSYHQPWLQDRAGDYGDDIRPLLQSGLFLPAVDYLKAQRARTKQINRLSDTVSRLGGTARLNACGEPLTRLEYQTILAWTLKINVVKIGFKYGQAIRHGNPIVLFTPLSHGGWKVHALHQRRPSCRSLPR